MALPMDWVWGLVGGLMIGAAAGIAEAGPAEEFRELAMLAKAVV